MDALTAPTIRPATLDGLPAPHALIERAYCGDRAWQALKHEADILAGQHVGEDEALSS